ncbi:MAG: hypothetical protein E7564_11160 [Ruminococcaceae bacterium]|nr:hypothetical protein [Oscillospiraceae bacterium]
MGYIRKRESELTCYQASGPLNPYVDIGQDIAIVYGVDPNMPERVKKFKERGYVVHLMTGIAWGNYEEYLIGKWDGREHWDECQRERDGSLGGALLHTKRFGYMCPTISYTDYLIDKLKAAVDAGVEAIHVEEPEFLNPSGYSEAFKREYRLFYGTDWVAAHLNVDAHYKVQRLKAYLYKRAVERISQSLREYSMVKYGKALRFYVPTHSLLNYTQWKVQSPEGTLTDIPSLDGYKAQVWTGTSREANVFKGVYKERAFETAFLEYGVMQELVRGTGRTMWFDNDPIDDRPIYKWEDYKDLYIPILVGSLMQPKINRFQICPWPHRFLNPEAKYPRGSADAESIPDSYRTLLFNIFQMLGTFGTEDYEYANKAPEVGVFLSDSAMFQRSFPDDVLSEREKYAPVSKVEIKAKANYEFGLEKYVATGDRLDFYASIALPLFYGMALPLLKGGLPVRPVQLENISRYPGYLDDYKLLVLSYEFQKPLTSDINSVLANYVKKGGILVYVGDGVDPFHKVSSWWNTGKQKDKTPLESLLRAMNIDENAESGEYNYGNGKFLLMRESPADLCAEEIKSNKYKDAVSKLLNFPLDKNYISLRRDNYHITSVMDESDSNEPYVLKGLFADMFDLDFGITKEKKVYPGEVSVLYDINTIKDKEVEIIGTSVRIESIDMLRSGITILGGGAECKAKIRLKLPKELGKVKISIRLLENDTLTNNIYNPEAEIKWDEESKTALISFDNKAGKLTMFGFYKTHDSY